MKIMHAAWIFVLKYILPYSLHVERMIINYYICNVINNFLISIDVIKQYFGRDNSIKSDIVYSNTVYLKISVWVVYVSIKGDSGV